VHILPIEHPFWVLPPRPVRSFSPVWFEVGRAWAAATTSGIFPMCEPVPMPTIE
jgi:hypothetical protein